jgi:hypothetical protein
LSLDFKARDGPHERVPRAQAMPKRLCFWAVMHSQEPQNNEADVSRYEEGGRARRYEQPDT